MQYFAFKQGAVIAVKVSSRLKREQATPPDIYCYVVRYFTVPDSTDVIAESRRSSFVVLFVVSGNITSSEKTVGQPDRFGYKYI